MDATIDQIIIGNEASATAQNIVPYPGNYFKNQTGQSQAFLNSPPDEIPTSLVYANMYWKKDFIDVSEELETVQLEINSQGGDTEVNAMWIDTLNFSFSRSDVDPITRNFTVTDPLTEVTDYYTVTAADCWPKVTAYLILADRDTLPLSGDYPNHSYMNDITKQGAVILGYTDIPIAGPSTLPGVISCGNFIAPEGSLLAIVFQVYWNVASMRSLPTSVYEDCSSVIDFNWYMSQTFIGDAGIVGKAPTN